MMSPLPKHPVGGAEGEVGDKDPPLYASNRVLGYY